MNTNFSLFLNIYSFDFDRRLAKSILILIPIFGLHFIFFAWLPYASLVKLNIGDCFEIVSTYIETSFNAFQVSLSKKKIKIGLLNF